MTHRFTLTVDKAWCANCGTLSTDGQCHCTKGHGPCKPDWKPFDGRAFEFIAELRSKLSAAEARRDALKNAAARARNLLDRYLGDTDPSQENEALLACQVLSEALEGYPKWTEEDIAAAKTEGARQAAIFARSEIESEASV
jgi:hypothetical protein